MKSPLVTTVFLAFFASLLLVSCVDSSVCLDPEGFQGEHGCVYEQDLTLVEQAENNLPEEPGAPLTDDDGLSLEDDAENCGQIGYEAISSCTNGVEALCVPRAASPEVCDGIDDDFNYFIEEAPSADDSEDDSESEAPVEAPQSQSGTEGGSRG